MNFKLYILYGLVCFFPNWVFRANLGINDILILFFFFFIIPIFIHNKIFKFYLKNSSEIIYYWLSLITFYTLDQNFSLWGVAKHGILNINLNSPYLNSILSATISIIFIYFLFYFSKKNALKIIFSFILVVFIFNILPHLQQKKFMFFCQRDIKQWTKSNGGWRLIQTRIPCTPGD